MANMQQSERVGDGLRLRAPAKLNLSLLIAGKRPDGFHEIETIMAKIDWYDEILIQPGENVGVELICEGPQWAPEGEGNLVYQAARRILSTCGETRDIRLTLTKKIPAGSGLGSASSDAAAALIGLNEYLDLRLPKASLVGIASELGSDVAFFLNGPLAFCTGKGEKVARLSHHYDFTALVMLPDISVSTIEVYAHYRHRPRLYEGLHRQITEHLQENRIDLAAKMCANMLESTCFHLFEELGRLKEAIESLGVGPVCLSGSGSAMFCILRDDDAERLEVMRDKITDETGCRSVVVRNNRW